MDFGPHPEVQRIASKYFPYPIGPVLPEGAVNGKWLRSLIGFIALLFLSTIFLNILRGISISAFLNVTAIHFIFTYRARI